MRTITLLFLAVCLSSCGTIIKHLSHAAGYNDFSLGGDQQEIIVDRPARGHAYWASIGNG